MLFYPTISLSSLIFSLSFLSLPSLFLIPSLSLAIVKLLSWSSRRITKLDRSSRRIGFLDQRGGEVGGAATMGVVARGQRSGDWRGDRCGDRHRGRHFVGLVVLTWWPVFGFGGRHLVG